MTDRVTPEVRSKIMASIKSQDTKMELAAKEALEPLGFEYHPKDIFGKPDFACRHRMIAVFLDGCFWHKCPDHCKVPDSKAWLKKLDANEARDRAVTNMLEAGGWNVVRVWEHEFNEAGITRVQSLMNEAV